MTASANESVRTAACVVLFVLVALGAVHAVRGMRLRGQNAAPWILAFVLLGPVALAAYYLTRPGAARQA